MKKVGLLGGSFDPVHMGHVQMAKSAADQLGLDEVWFVPTSQTPLKSRLLTDARHRVEMLKTILEIDPRFRLCEEELNRPGPSYTIDTLRALTEKHQDTEFFYVIGEDQARHLDEWKDADELKKLATFVVAKRDLDPSLSSYAQDHNEKELVLNGQDAKAQDDLLVLHMDPVDVSSSEIRNGQKVNLLYDKTLKYILDNELYLMHWVKGHLTPHRFAHSVSVARICRELAQIHNLDPHKAYLAGLFHDVCKDLDIEILKDWIDTLFKDQHVDHEALWHGYVGAEVVDRYFGMHDQQIRNAIFHHTKGSSYDPYAMILFIADKVDPLRGYDSSAMLQAARDDLYMGFQFVKRENKEFLKKTGVVRKG